MSFKFSLVIPCYNESENIPLLLNKIHDVFRTRKDIEVILVDNGSTDNSSESFISCNNEELSSFVRVVSLMPNQGYGGGILAGLRVASGEFLSWTHADLQTDPKDLLEVINLLERISNDSSNEIDNVFVKGKRYGRPLSDVFFTLGMGCFETLLFRHILFDINAQPTFFSKKFFDTWINPPSDFSLDLYAFVMAQKAKLRIFRIPVYFGKRIYGDSKWNIDWRAKAKFIKRTISYSLELFSKGAK